jgi:DNA-binding transcriptional MerR regulator/predicted transcriptional regulator YdeE
MGQGAKEMVMFRIGEFSRLTLVPVTALRYYADLGLLVPAHVDPESGYRFFTADQLPLVNRLLALKDLGLSLDEIKAVLTDEIGAEELRGMLRLKRAEIGREVVEQQARLDRVEARLRLIEKEGAMPDREIVVKQVESVRGVGCRDRLPVSEIGEFVGDVMGGVMMNGLMPAGPPLSIYHDPEFDPESADVTFMVPTTGEPRGSTPAGRELIAIDVPAAEMAVVVHVGPYGGLHEAYQALAAWFAREGKMGSGPAYEIYMTGPDDPGDPVTEIRMAIA